MYTDLKKRPKIPFQAIKEVTFPPNAVTGFGFSYGSIPAYQYEMLKGHARRKVDPIQVGPTG
ncbi:MAG TPA: hypothetical protein VIJ61_03995 [Thermoanaerobaculia bacterium]